MKTHEKIYNKHKNHAVWLQPGSGPHAYELRCRECNTHIQWISQSQAQVLVAECGFKLPTVN